MSPFSWSSAISPIVKVFGSQKILSSLYAKLRRGSMESRAKALDMVADTLIKNEKMKAMRVSTMSSLMDLMRDAGFSENQIQKAIIEEVQMEDAADAYETILNFITSGKIDSITLNTLGYTFNELDVTTKNSQPKQGGG